jgi:hypothetical protein
MGQRIYNVRFEAFIDGRWNPNMFTRSVAVIGGAEQAIKVALEREKKRDRAEREEGERIPRYRVEQVTLVAVED